MNLKDFLEKRDKPPELFWSLVIEKDWVQAGIWYIDGAKAEVINISPPAAWEGEEELVGACDAALSSCIAKLPENYNEPSKTVFGVASNWVKGGEIEDEYLAKIKTVCTDLSLTPVGFVVLPEAIAHLYKAEEGSPVSAVIVGLGTEYLEISVFKLGNLVGTTTVARSVSLTDDVTEGLTRFEGATPLPSRIIVYDGKGGELEDAKEELVKASWEGNEKVKFLHTPKAEILTSDRKVLATCLAGANEIGNVSSIVSTKEEPVTEELPPAKEVENIAPVPTNELNAEDLGFVLGKDIAEVEEPLESAKVSIQTPLPTPPTVVAKPKIPTIKIGMGVKKLFHNFSSKIKVTGQNQSPRKNYNLIYIVIVLVAVVAGLGVGIWFIPKAVVTVYVSPQTYQERVSLSFSTTGVFDENRAVIPGTEIESNASGEKTKSTTGTKLVGDKASGTVQIANGNGNPINLSAGTILTSSGGLKFVTNTDASVSGQLLPGSPGTATLNVSAGDIGAQYNLAKGEVFKVGLFDKSQVAATSQADFAGGSSQQLAAVSADDQKKLEQDLKTELSAQVSDDLSSKIDTNQVFVNDLSNISISSETFDHKVGDVADTLKINLTVSGKGVAADKDKLLTYAKDSLKSKIPQGFGLKSNQIGFKFIYSGTTDGNLNYNADINANFLPLLNSSDILSKIAGKPVGVVENYLSTIQGYVRADIRLNPSLPGPLKTLPFLTNNITIDVVPEQ